ncbi:MAG: CsbD family protein [Candidatus Nanopelagicales bacterium]|nr:CsbD family protein [Candidatus Nanopelagicales bacterium]
MTAQTPVIPVGPQSSGFVHVPIAAIQKSAVSTPGAAGRRRGRRTMGATSDQVKGHAKEAAGIVAGDKELQSTGRADRKAGEAQAQVDHAVHTVEDGLDSARTAADSGLDKAKHVIDTGFDRTKDALDTGLDRTKDLVDTGLDRTKGMVDSGVDRAKHLLYTK